MPRIMDGHTHTVTQRGNGSYRTSWMWDHPCLLQGQNHFSMCLTLWVWLRLRARHNNKKTGRLMLSKVACNKIACSCGYTIAFLLLFFAITFYEKGMHLHEKGICVGTTHDMGQGVFVLHVSLKAMHSKS